MSTPPSGTIAVFGGTGKQGGSVVDALLTRGTHVRALVRDTESDRARALADRSVELSRIAIDDATSLSTALTGVDAFFFMTTPEGHSLADVERETRQGTALVDAAVDAGVPHVVFSSVGGAERDSGVPHFDSKYRVEEHLQRSGLRATVVRPVAFMDNFAFMGPSVENGEVVLRMPLPDDIGLQLVAVRDIGLISAAFLLGTAEAPGGAIEIAGDHLTGSRIAAAFGEHAGLPSRYEALPLHVLGDDPDAQAMFRWFAETPAYQADVAAVKAIEPTTWDLPTWLRESGWSLPRSQA
ncbi:NmrA/HSCARG family protein [Umezawaea endophytica]|uniref:NmrA/HSCARG family protein n=1 Tax=Umezawaea endophytica TaxID=1654476 RepID=A0A9X3A270_9PSEU|nr:NmrA/HSCARG family protein [Umezawaea endophytica]MCS7480404.1 NmrA/HSCARG family protein [Umezawaea endophytica]